MFWHIDTDIIALLVICALYLYTVRMLRNDELTGQNKGFVWCLRCGVLMTMVDIAASLIMEEPVKNALRLSLGTEATRGLFQVFMTLYLAVLMLVIVSWFLYALTILFAKDLNQRRRIMIAVLVVYGLYTALVLSNPWSELFFPLSPELEYSRGVLFLPLTIGLYAAYVVALTVLIFTRRRFIPKGYPWGVLLMSPIILSVSIPVQLLNPGWLVIIPAYMLCLVLAFLYFQNLRVRSERAQLKQFTELVEHFACGVAISQISPEGKLEVKHLSGEYCAMFEEDAASLIAHYREDLLYGVHPDDREKMQTTLEALGRGEEYDVTYRFTTAAGSQKWIRAQTEFVAHEDGSATAYSTYNDLTALYRAQQQLSDVIQTVPCGICLYQWDGRDLRPLIANAQFSEMIGLDAISHLSGVTRLDYQYVHPDDLPKLQSASMEALSASHRIDITFRVLNVRTQEYVWLRERGALNVQSDGTQLVYVSYNDVTQEHIAEQQLRESEQTLEFATEQAGLRYWRYDALKDCLYPDARRQKELDLPPVMENFLTDWLTRDFIHPESAAVYRDACLRLKAGEKQVVFEVQGYSADRTVHWYRYCISNLFGADGVPTSAVGTSMLIDGEVELRTRYEMERKRTSKADDSLLAHALLNLTTGRLVEYYDRDGATISSMPRDAFLYSQNNARLLIDEKERAVFLALNDRDELLKRFARGETEFSLDYRRRIAPDEIHWVRSALHLVRDPKSGDVMLFEYWYDIEDEKMLEMMYKRIATESYEFVGRINGRSKRFYVLPRPGVSHTMPPSSGEDADEYTIRHYGEYMHPDDRGTAVENMLVDNIRRHLKTTPRFQYTYREIQLDGALRYKKITQFYIDEQREMIVVLREDVTELIHSEAEKNALLASALEAANQASVAKSQFLSRVSHELRTPLNAILGFMELARGADNEQVEICLNHSDVAARQLLAIINDVLDVSAIESGKMKIAHAPFNFKQLIQSITNLFVVQCHQKKLAFETRLLTHVDEWLMGDRLRVNQILLNLLSNAVKFTESGHVWLTIRQMEGAGGKLLMRFEVSDTGCGMSEEMLSRLFKPFEQENAMTAQKHGGNGLGLSIVGSLVQLMHGVVSVKSALGEGTTFTVDLPFSMSEANAEFEQLIDANAIHVLTVDDEPTEREYLATVLKRVGVRFAVVESGECALSELERARNAGDPYNIALVDWAMPNMSGIETVRRIRAQYAEPIITIVISAYEHYQADESAKAAGANLFISKPLFQSSILDLFATLTGGRVARKAADMPDYDFSGLRVLLAEDNHLNRIVAEGLLTQKFHMACDCASDGQIALDMFLASTPGYYDAILMDVQMPNLNGYEATRAIRASSHPSAHSVPIIALTANAFNEDIVRSLSNGMNAHVAKPIDPALLAATLRTALRGGGEVKNPV